MNDITRARLPQAGWMSHLGTRHAVERYIAILKGRFRMPLLVTSAAAANGNGYGALLAFDADGRLLGAFSDDARITDPRGLAVDENGELSFSQQRRRSGAGTRSRWQSRSRYRPDRRTQPRRRQFWAGQPVLRRPARRAHDHGLSSHAAGGWRISIALRHRVVSARLRIRPRRQIVSCLR